MLVRSVSVGVHDHAPAATGAVQSADVPSDTVTVEPSSPVPMNVGVVSGVPLRSAGDAITGAAGPACRS